MQKITWVQLSSQNHSNKTDLSVPYVYFQFTLHSTEEETREAKSKQMGQMESIFDVHRFCKHIFTLTGLFKICNKILFGVDILLEWREMIKTGLPLTNSITEKLNGFRDT